MRLRRSLLFVPGSTPERIAKAVATAADGVILDLEDAVAPAEKPRAREWVVAALRGVDFRGKERIVRVNALDGPWGADDLAAVVPTMPDAVALPKISAPADVARADEALAGHERAAGLETGRVRLHLLLETAAGVLDALAIARASARAAAIFYGAGDLSRETRGALVPGRATELYALSHLLMVARAAGLEALDTPYFDLTSEAGLEAHTRFAVELGYDGKTVIHPKQIDVVNRLFTPSKEVVDQARRVVAAYEEAEAAGDGALTVDGQFVDAVHVATAREMLTRARLAGVA
jgi:citrate lyase subunit beta/citryl-CoA lyase